MTSCNEHSKSKEKTRVSLVFPLRFSRVLLRHTVLYYSLETCAMLFYSLIIKTFSCFLQTEADQLPRPSVCDVEPLCIYTRD